MTAKTYTDGSFSWKASVKTKILSLKSSQNLTTTVFLENSSSCCLINHRISSRNILFHPCSKHCLVKTKTDGTCRFNYQERTIFQLTSKLEKLTQCIQFFCRLIKNSSEIGLTKTRQNAKLDLSCRPAFNFICDEPSSIFALTRHL